MWTAAAKDPAPNKWWPQAWPAVFPFNIFFSGTAACDIPGRASYSESKAIIGPPFPYSAINAVGIPATPVVTEKPSLFNTFLSNALLFSSKNPNSANSQILCATSLKVPELFSISKRIFSLIIVSSCAEE